MHTLTEMGASVPAFLGKLWRLVEDPETDELISWAPNGRSFFIKNQARFARELLPHYYKHNNMASFVRQLNMYGFHKKVSVELGGLKCDRDEMEFAHQYFRKDHPYLLDHIKRKIASNKTQDLSQQPIKPELMNKMLTEVRSMRGRQENFDSKLGVMKRENEALWRELALLRQKHLKQQQIVDKLIHFFISLVNSNRNSGLGMKRRYPLMIDDASRQRIKQQKLSKIQSSPTGPAIHELDASDSDMYSEYIVAEMLDNDSLPTVESPDHCSPEENEKEYYVDESDQMPQEVKASQNLHAHPSRKRVKNKKKGRKNKVPIKILIPSSENGGETREETYLLEMPQKSLNNVQLMSATETIPKIRPNSSSLSKASSILATSMKPKSVPFSTVRSSKLAAMAANMKKNEPDLDLDLESLQDSTETVDPKNDSLIKLENILIGPDINEDYNETEEHIGNTMPSSVSSLSSIGTNNSSPRSNGLTAEERSPDIADVNDGAFNSFDFLGVTPNDSTASSSINRDQQKSSGASTSKSLEDSQKNMSLSCVNQTNTDETNYRLDPMMECDSHIDNMQNDLDNLRELLSGQNVSIDANTLLGLFGTEDAMNPYGFPMNPELDPQERDVDDDHHVNDPTDLHNNRELMTYNTGNSLLDFEDDMFLGASSSPASNMVADNTNGGLASDSLEIVDHKGNIFDSLIANNNAST